MDTNLCFLSRVGKVVITSSKGESSFGSGMKWFVSDGFMSGNDHTYRNGSMSQ